VQKEVAAWRERQSRLRILARHPIKVPPTETAAEKIWRRASANCQKVFIAKTKEKKINKMLPNVK
jgi:hypothetical protein